MSQVDKIGRVLQAIRRHRIVIIYRGLEPEECLEVSQVLYDAGIRLFEVTMNSRETEDSIRLLCSELEPDAHVGAGTVMNAEQVESAFEAGATYIISPNTNVDVIGRTKELGMVSIPGAMTPSEVDLASRSGGDIIKIFPINVLGAEFIAQLNGPLDNIDFLPCGGLRLELVEELFEAGCAAIGMGVQLLGEGLVEDKNWEELCNSARDVVQASEVGSAYTTGCAKPRESDQSDR